MTPAQIISYLAIGTSGVVSLVTAVRAGRHITRWTFAAGMILLGLEEWIATRSNISATAEAIVTWQQWRLMIVALLPGCWLVFGATYARGSTSLRHRWRLWIGPILSIMAAALAYGFRDQLITTVQQTLWDTQWQLKLGRAGQLIWGVMLVGSVAVVVNLERTLRASVGTARWRIKYMLLGVGLIFVVKIYTSSQILLFHGIDSELEVLNSAALLVGVLLAARSLYRTGSFELEVYPSQDVLQKSLTVLIAGAYLLIVGVLAKVVTYIGGDSAFAAKAFLVLAALVLLAVTLQSDRARMELRRFVARNFRRSPYDHQKLWKVFVEGTATCANETELSRSLTRLVAETFQTLSVSIWLLSEDKSSLVCAHSTFAVRAPNGPTQISPTPLTENEPKLGEAKVAIPLGPDTQRHCALKPEPFVLEKSNESWAEELRRRHPVQFEKGGDRVAVPLIGRGQLLGVIVVGDRVGSEAFSVGDFDMLKCVADHAAASLLSIQLSQRLIEARELEAFQAMAAFFVHDLKNSASTLNLMLKNLPVHFDDPEFRQDALRGIGKTVTHINQLISRLGMLRHELRIDAKPCDLNEVVEEVLAGIQTSTTFTLAKETHALPLADFDRDQIQKVLTNLVLNAIEALKGTGTVRVGTRVEGEWVIASVADDGCGMSEEFMAKSLFRPFQTTKKNGLGIGMFQSRMIVEAHNGRVAVSSIPGHGTTFQIFLRASAAASS